MKKLLRLNIITSVVLLLLGGNLYSQNDAALLPELKFHTGQKHDQYASVTLEKNYKLKFEDPKLIKGTSTLLIKKEKSYKLRPVRFGIVAGLMTVGWLGMHIYYSNTWWKDKVHYFKFDEDTYYARNVDKMSHIYTANLITVGGAQIFEWTGMSPTTSLIVGASTAMAYETYIEINDGSSPNWGFDWGDMAANFIGSLWPVAQNYVKPLRTINFKWSFEPDWLSKKLRKYPDLLDDYTSMKFWISFSPYDILPKKIARYYPSFLGFALGVNLQNASHATGTLNAYKEFYLAFDIDVNKLPGNTDFLIKLKKILNFYHIPTPGIKIYKNTVWYGLLF